MTEKATDMDSDLRSRMVSVEHQTQGHGQRLSALETWQRQKDIDSARHDERWKHMDDRFNRLEAKLVSVNDTLTWITRLIIGGIILAIIAFMVGGGFSPAG